MFYGQNQWQEIKNQNVDFKYLIIRNDSTTPYLRESFCYYGMEIKIVTDYEKGIQHLQTEIIILFG